MASGKLFCAIIGLAAASPVCLSQTQSGLIAFPGRDAQGRQQLFTITADGANRRQITFDGDNSLPSWSPDGAHLVCVSRTPTPNLTIMDADGGNRRTLLVGDAPDWGPNDRIAYAAGQPAEIWIVNAAGGTARPLTSGGGHGGRIFPRWSPDGTRLVFVQLSPQVPTNSGNGCPLLPFRPELWVVNADGANPRLLTTPGFFNHDSNGQLINSANDANAPDWSGAGDAIAFWSGQEQCYGQVWRINADGSGRTQLTRAPIPSHNDDPGWSPDGTKLLFTTDRNGRAETWVMDADGGNPRFLTQCAPGPGPANAAWQPVPNHAACRADFNGSGMVTVRDIFDFLGAYFGGDPRADYDGNGHVQAQDIFAFIMDWFAGCSSVPEPWEPERRMTRSAGESRTSINFARSIAADARGGVHIVWREQATDGPSVNYKRSPDGGVSWGPAVRLGPCPGPSESGNPSIAVSGDTLHVAWWDQRTTPPQVWYKRSLDGGVTWEPELAITNSPAPAAFPSITAWGNDVHVVYVDQRDGNAEVYYVRSRDAGQTWNNPVRLSSTPYHSYTPTIAVSGTNVYVAWTDTRDTQSTSTLEEEYFRRSADGGNTWAPEQRITFDPPGQPANSWAPSLAAAGSHVWITWFDDRGNPPGDFDIYLDDSPNFGATWRGNRRLTQAPGTSMRPVIASLGAELYITWWSTGDGSDKVHVLHSPNLGTDWNPGTVVAESPNLLMPGIAAAASGVHVAWTDGRDGNAEVYYRRIAGAPIPVGNGRIAFAQGQEGAKQIVTMNPDGSDPRQLTFGGDNLYPAWSKDGTKLAFSTDRTGVHEIWTMNPDGTGASQASHGSAGGGGGGGGRRLRPRLVLRRNAHRVRAAPRSDGRHPRGVGDERRRHRREAADDNAPSARRPHLESAADVGAGRLADLLRLDRRG